MDTCSICLEESDDVRETCDTCRIKLCVNCWLRDCKTYCPICQRQQLNKKYICHLCFSYCCIKNINVCCLCNKWICSSCHDMTHHSCNAILVVQEDIHIIDDPYDIIRMFHKHKIDGVDFMVLGKMTMDIGDIYVIKDVDEHFKEVIMFIWDVENNEALFDRVSKYTKMKKYKVGYKFCRGVKIYYPNNRFSIDHIALFVNKIRNISICCGCCENMSIFDKKYCHTCIKKRHYFKRWTSILKRENKL